MWYVFFNLFFWFKLGLRGIVYKNSFFGSSFGRGEYKKGRANIKLALGTPTSSVK